MRVMVYDIYNYHIFKKKTYMSTDFWPTKEDSIVNLLLVLALCV